MRPHAPLRFAMHATSQVGQRRCPDFRQADWDDHLAAHVAVQVPGWLAEDLGHECDWTTLACVSASSGSELAVVARAAGIVAGLPAASIVAEVAAPTLRLVPLVTDGTAVAAGTTLAMLAGPTRAVLTAERVVLNLLGRLSGVATAVGRLVDAVAGTTCRVYDTRKTVPGWRLLDKYAVRAGGGWNHRTGLYDAILIKDNHLAALAADGVDPAGAVRRARQFVGRSFPAARAASTVIEIELDTPDHLEAVLAERPHVVLLDNMPPALLERCIAIRDRVAPDVVIEASGGIRPESVAAIAATGVDRVSTGWPTHAAPWLDIGLDWADVARSGGPSSAPPAERRPSATRP